MTDRSRRVYSRRDALKIVGGMSASAAIGSRQPTTAARERITKENVDQFHLKDIATPKGKIITFSATGTDLQFSNILQSIIRAEAHRLEDDGDFIWQGHHWKDGQLIEAGNGLRPSPDIKDIDWGRSDYAIDFARKNTMVFGVGPLIFGDMSEGQSTDRVQFVPDWLINGGYTYDQSIQIGNDTIKAVIDHLKAKHVFNPKHHSAAKELRIGVLNECLNNPADGRGNVQIDVNNPATWFKGANYWQAQAESAGDPGTNGIPRYFREFLITARHYAGNANLGISDYDIETWNDYRWGGPNQKTQALYNLVQRLQDDPDLKEVVEKNFYVGMQAHWSGPIIQRVGIDAFAADVADTVGRFRGLGVDVILTETTISDIDLPGTRDEQVALAGEMWGKVPVAALKAGASELTIYYAADNPDARGVPQEFSGFYYSNYAKKPAYAALANGLLSLPDTPSST